jgi:Fur family transcriptional regulator, ferric uptake regulator
MRPHPGLLQRQISKNHLKLTRQRREIFEAFIGMARHVTAEELYQEVAKRTPRVGLATIYRTLNLLCRFGMAEVRQFGDGHARYDPIYNKHHHDHLICTQCGKIVEFENQRIEQLQERVARRHQFVILRHKLELYGHCRECQSREGSRRSIRKGA